MISARFLESRSRGDVQSRWLWSHAGKMFIVHKHTTKQYEQSNKPANHQFFFLTLFRSGKIIHSWIRNASRSQTTKNVYTHTHASTTNFKWKHTPISITNQNMLKCRLSHSNRYRVNMLERLECVFVYWFNYSNAAQHLGAEAREQRKRERE